MLKRIGDEASRRGIANQRYPSSAGAAGPDQRECGHGITQAMARPYRSDFLRDCQRDAAQ